MKHITDALTLAIAGQLHCFDFQKHMAEKSFTELNELVGEEAVIKRYRNDRAFHARVCALVSSSLICIKDLPQQIETLTRQRDELLAELTVIANTDPIDAALDPQRAVRIARTAIASVKESK